MTETIRFCTECYENKDEIHQLKPWVTHDDMFRCAGCHKDMMSFRTYTQKEIVRCLEERMYECDGEHAHKMVNLRQRLRRVLRIK